ncbi:MAG: ABC transporter ATP-binding protein [Firmicutes bacterium HGW-Firmicutes-15]|nr:MAG: ABC transporter ATP-binding protein [Firmicutes bacterium HGW-Firmicutes-15]
MKHFLQRIFLLLRPYKKTAILLLLGMIVHLAYETLMPFSFKYLIDDAIVPGNHAFLVGILAALAIGALLVAIIAVGRDFMYARLSADILTDLRLSMFGHLQELPIEFFNRTRPGDIATNFSTDLSSVEIAIVQAIPAGVMAVIGLFFSATVLFLLQWQLALLALLGLPVCLIGPRLLGRRATDANDQYKDEQANLLNTVTENASAQTVIKAFNLRQLVFDRFRAQASQLSRAAVSANFLSFMMERTPALTALAFHVTVVCVAAGLAFRGDLSIGALVSFNAVFITVSLSIYDLTGIFPQLLQAASGMERIDRLLREVPVVMDVPNAVSLPRLSTGIRFNAVDFSYSPERLALAGVNLSIPRGDWTALVGSSGSGKSTMIGLLMRYRDPDRGTVTLDGIDLRQAEQESLRIQTGIVLQDNFLFNTTVRENIRLGRPDATQAEIEVAARAAEIHEAILGLSHGYDTPVGERGGMLSGGQRQRVALARALVRDPEILVLDEATSALDPTTEARVNDTLRRIAQGRTVVSVTHRLAAITHANRICVFDNGRIVEQGSHEELLAMQGHYSALWQKQSGFILSGDGEMAEVTVERLKMVTVLAELEDDLLAEVSGLFVAERHPAGRVVVHEGDSGDKFYIIVRGRMSVTRRQADKSELKLNLLEDGDHFGEIALLKSIPRTATVTTTVPTVILSLQRELFLNLIEKAPHLRKALEEHAARY